MQIYETFHIVHNIGDHPYYAHLNDIFTVCKLKYKTKAL